MTAAVSASSRGVKHHGAFVRYRIMAYVTGVMLLLLVLVAMPLKYFAHEPAMVAVVGTAHGFLFMVYLVAALDLGVRRRWNLLELGLVMVAGTVPFASFFAEHHVAHEPVDPRTGRPLRR